MDAKKSRVSFSYLDEHLQEGKNVESYRDTYAASKPYPHGVISPLCAQSICEKVREEVVEQLTTRFKETDLFKLYQTTDLANVDRNDPELAGKLPTLLALRDELYSERFRKIVARISGCPDLTDRVDMAASAYDQGCHLLCHDDVIGTRAVSFIIYFSAEDWTEKDGGALQLYDVDLKSAIKNTDPCLPTVQGVPEPYPAASLLPLFNTMAFFRVEPGRSFHSVQEVLRDGSPRLSIQGWYHAPEAPAGSELASLNQLKEVKDYSKCFEDLPQVESETLSKDDKSQLGQLINSAYLTDDALQSMQAKFEEDSSICLRSFLRADLADKIQELTTKLDCEQELWGVGLPADSAGVGDGWETVGPAHMQRYLKYNHSKELSSESIGAQFDTLCKDLFSSAAFSKWLCIVSSGRVTGVRSEVRRFRPGLDYTVAHHGLLEEDARLDATLCFVKSDEDIEKADWDQGDVGGFECYLAAENENNVAAEVYCDDDAAGSDLLSVSACSNTLNLVLRDPGTMRFIKYISSRAAGSRWDVSSVYRIEYDDESEDDEPSEEQ